MSAPRRPDYRMKATTRPGVHPHREGVVGAGWRNPDGSVSVKLDPFAVLAGADDLIITLFPMEARSEAQAAPAPVAPPPPR